MKPMITRDRLGELLWNARHETIDVTLPTWESLGPETRASMADTAVAFVLALNRATLAASGLGAALQAPEPTAEPQPRLGAPARRQRARRARP